MARKTKEEARETRERILDAAVRVFFEKGVSRASLEEIAAQAAVTRGAIYWHFKNKRDIFSALHQRLHNSFMDILVARLERLETDPVAQLKQLTIDLFLDVDGNENKKRTLGIFLMKCDYSGDMAVFLQEQMKAKQAGFRLFAEYFSKAQAQALMSDAHPPEIMARAYTCFISGIINEYLRFPGLIDLKTQIAPMMDIYFSQMYPVKQAR